jgi:hypothetical protein
MRAPSLEVVRTKASSRVYSIPHILSSSSVKFGRAITSHGVFLSIPGHLASLYTLFKAAVPVSFLGTSEADLALPQLLHMTFQSKPCLPNDRAHRSNRFLFIAHNPQPNF